MGGVEVRIVLEVPATVTVMVAIRLAVKLAVTVVSALKAEIPL